MCLYNLKALSLALPLEGFLLSSGVEESDSAVSAPCSRWFGSPSVDPCKLADPLQWRCQVIDPGLCGHAGEEPKECSR